MFSEECLRIHERLDLIEIEKVMSEGQEAGGPSLDVCSVKPSDLVYSAPSLKTLGLSLHKVGRDCLLLDKQDSTDYSGVFKELKICLSACHKLAEKHHR